MGTTIRCAIAVAATLLSAPSARPCDPENATEYAEYDVCTADVLASAARLCDPDNAREYAEYDVCGMPLAVAQRPAMAQDADEVVGQEGAASGEPSIDVQREDARLSEFLNLVWTAP
jgi:hypothetical protein